jgi:hypothetical protein
MSLPGASATTVNTRLRPMSSPLSSLPSDAFNDDGDVDTYRLDLPMINEDNEDLSDDETSEAEEMETRTKAEILQEIVNVLRRYNWSFPKLIKVWAGIQTSSIELEHLRYRTLDQRRRSLQQVMGLLVEYDVCTPAVLTGGVINGILAEIDELVKHSWYFGVFVAQEATELERDLERFPFGKAQDEIQRLAPTWYAFIRRVLQNQRAHRGSYTTSQEDNKRVAGKVCFITSMVCHSRAMKKSNRIHSLLDLYLHGAEVKRRVIDTCSGMGLCHSYSTGARLVHSIAENAKV